VSRTQINFRVSEEEKSRWEKAAAKSKIPLGTWIKEVLNAASKRSKSKGDEEIRFDAPTTPTESVQPAPVEPDRTESAAGSEEADAPVGETGKTDRPSKKSKTCPHGKPRGYHCGLCGGKAKVK
jgi:hypothetical protein